MTTSTKKKGNDAEKAYEAYLQKIGYVTDRAKPERIMIPGMKFPVSRAHDHFGAFDIIAIGPSGIVFAQITANKGELSRKRDVVMPFPWPRFLAALETVRVQIVLVEKVAHPKRRGKCWRFQIERFDPTANVRSDKDDPGTVVVLFDGEAITT